MSSLRFGTAWVAALTMILPTTAAWSDDNAPAGNPTFYSDVLPIVQNNCQNCHRPAGANLGGLIAPMSLMDYKEVRPWAKSIAKEVASERMPPWHADERFDGTFHNERGLTESEIATVVRWAETGAAAGNPKDAPEPKVFPEREWSFGEPDLILEMPEEFFVADDIEDHYHNFTVEIPKELLPEDRWIQAVEYKPSGPVVHHIIGYAYPEGSEARADRGMVGGIAPGTEPRAFPDGYGLKLHSGGTFVFAMHYHKEAGPGSGVPDRSHVAFKFYPEDAKVRPLHIEPIGNHLFELPPGHPNWEVGGAQTFERPIEIIEYQPHMHLRGKDARYTAFYPDGKVEELLYVPNYDFNWQTSYEYPEPKTMPAGTRLEVTMHFDNSTGNPANPDPDQSIRFGGPTTDEMMLGWMSWAYADQDPQLASAVE